MKRAMFFDIDGTLYTAQIGHITNRVKNAILNIQKQGYLCFISTGRSFGFVYEEIKNMHFDGYICANGSHIIYHNKNIFVDYIHADDVYDIISQLNGLEYNLESMWGTCIDKNDTHLRNYYIAKGINAKCFKDVFDSKVESKNTLKIEIWITNASEEQYVLSLSRAFTVENHVASSNHIELFHPGHTKATGALRLAAFADISLKDSYSFGDSENDIELAKIVGHPIVMENGNDHLKDIAESIVPDVKDDGVAVYLEQLLQK